MGQNRGSGFPKWVKRGQNTVLRRGAQRQVILTRGWQESSLLAVG